MRTYRFLLHAAHAALSLISLVAAIAGLPVLCAGYAFVAVGAWAQRKADRCGYDLDITRPSTIREAQP